MLKKENTGDAGGGGGDNGGNNNWARVCDTCRAAACTVYCKADSAYLCASCDARIHAANRVASRHERVWVCQACERSPATFLCKADAASLCSECDASIHSANPLARRHQRVPILPISGDIYGHHAAVGETNEDLFISEDGEEAEEEEEDETASWLLLNPAKKKNNNKNNNNNGFLFGGEVDEYLDLVEYNSNSCPENQYTDNHNQQYNCKNYGSDESVVPVQCEEAAKDQIHPPYHNFQLGLEFESSKSSYSFNGSFNLGVPISSMEVGMVPNPTIGEVSISHSRPPKGTIDLFSSPGMQISSLLSPRDREARVLRYREKKKTRKFEKTIRYASRKAYAETRPRIKGRFAKRNHPDQVEVDHMFSTTLITDTGYGLVPQF